MHYAIYDLAANNEKVNRVGSEMSDEVLRSFMKPVKVEDIATRTGRGASDLFPRMVKLFITGGAEAMDIDYKHMDRERKWAAVAQSLRLALKNTAGENGEPLSTIAYVSVSKAEQTVYLRKKGLEGPTGPGRPAKKTS
jgi:hypothetical protein